MDPDIVSKLSVLAKNLITPASKQQFIDIITGELTDDVERFIQFSKNFTKNPELKCIYAEFIANFGQKRKLSAENGEKVCPKRKKFNDPESLWQCDDCGQKLSTKSNLKRHIISRHTKIANAHPSDDKKSIPRKTTKSAETTSPKNAENQKTTRDLKCKFCNVVCKRAKLYTHYVDEHSVQCPEDIFFNNGNVLVSHVDTEGGTAKWFVEQREKAKETYEGKCKLCDIVLDSAELMRKHYTVHSSMCGHNVDPSRLETIEHFFRADKNAQKRDQNSPKNKEVKRETSVKVDAQRTQTIDTGAGLHLYVCVCGVATEKCDSAVEHAQHHLVNISPVTQTCAKCELTFGATCFAEHQARHQHKDFSPDNFIRVKFDYTKLQNPVWYDMFDLSRRQKLQIVRSSIYKHTRNVKLNHAYNTGVPVYQCSRCQLCIKPSKVESHCYNGDICVSRKPKGHSCPECDLNFYSNNALQNHEKKHKTGPPRLIVFNNKEDYNFNRTLLKLKHGTSTGENAQTPIETSAKIVKNVETPKINVISNIVLKLCNKCNNYVNFTEYKEHCANHEKVENIRMMAVERDLNQLDSNSDNVDHQNEEAANVAPSESALNDNIGEQSDSDSCTSARHAIVVTDAMIDEGERHQKVALDRSENVNEWNLEDDVEDNMTRLFSDVGSLTPLGIEEETQSTQDLRSALEADGDTTQGRPESSGVGVAPDKPNRNYREFPAIWPGNRVSSRHRVSAMLEEDYPFEGSEELDAKISALVWS